MEVLRQDDPRFPAQLVLLDEPVEQLWIEGDLSLLKLPRVAIIGSRDPSAYGMTVAYDAAKALAAQGACIVSGMAQGLDTQAHHGALDAGGKTIAVLGTGMDVDYPRSNRQLVRTVRERGLVLTEFAPGTEPRRQNFPRRNRIIAALSQCLLVVEGRLKGGTSNTAKWAAEIMEHGELFGVPGRIGDELAESPNAIIHSGGSVYLHPNDILLKLGLPTLPEPDRPKREARREQRELARAARAHLSEAEATLFDLLTKHPTHVDVLATKSAVAPGLLLAALSSLELQGLVMQLPGKHFARAA